ncbi:hypothetical protein MWU63_06815 [Pseudohalocynthiibacter sp. F2068]|nr:hypothetical protein [Pseudohalocynthiibacter sp. F2068]
MFVLTGPILRTGHIQVAMIYRVELGLACSLAHLINRGVGHLRQVVNLRFGKTLSCAMT